MSLPVLLKVHAGSAVGEFRHTCPLLDGTSILKTFVTRLPDTWYWP